MYEQEGAVQCEKCMRWFCSRGRLTRHRCRRKEVVEDGAAGGVGVSQGQVTDIFQVKEARDRKTKLNLLILDHYMKFFSIQHTFCILL